MRRLRRSLCLLWGAAAWAQVFPPPSDTLCWEGGRLFRHPYQGQHLLESSRGPAPSLERDVGRVDGLDPVCRLDGRYVGVRKAQLDGVRGFEVVSSPDASTWTREAFLPRQGFPDQPEVWGIYPLGGDDFLIRAGWSFFRDRQGESPLALVRRDPLSGTLRFVRIVDMGLGREGGRSVIPAKAFGVLYLPRVCYVPEGLVLVCPVTGHCLWALREGAKGIKIRHRFLYPEVLARLKQGGKLERVVLGAQPTATGEVWIATRSREGVLKGMAAWETLVPPDAPLPQKAPGVDDATYLEQVKAALQREVGQRTQTQKDGADMAIRAFPEIVWWELDPERGSLEQINPPGAKTLLRGAADIQHFTFRFRADGRLVFD